MPRAHRYFLPGLWHLTHRCHNECAGLGRVEEAAGGRAEWIGSQRGKVNQRDATWAEAVATGSRKFVEEVKEKLGIASEGAQRSTADRRICSQRNDRTL